MAVSEEVFVVVVVGGDVGAPRELRASCITVFYNEDGSE